MSYEKFKHAKKEFIAFCMTKGFLYAIYPNHQPNQPITVALYKGQLTVLS